MFKIEKGLIHPAYKFKAFEEAPWDQMEVGDSFLAKNVSETEGKAICRIYGQKLNKNFDATLEKENEGIRFWRVEEDRKIVDYEIKLLNLLRKNGKLTKGVILNRFRGMTYPKLNEMLVNLQKQSLIIVHTKNHPRRKDKIFLYEAV